MSEVIIRKKIKKGHGGGHHGGAWKVAYADFVTAMMALFLVLWLVAVLSIDSKKAIAQYFRSYTVFKGKEAGGATGFSVMQGGPVKLDPEEGGLKGKVKKLDTISVQLNNAVEEKLQEFKDQILISTTDEGVRLELLEKDNNPMFELGKANLLPKGKHVLSVISSVVKDFPNTITIEGHTDSKQYPTEDYSNWELAADRANAARRELLRNGLEPEKITRVASFADAVPIKTDRSDPLNRRVSILIEGE